MRLWASFIIFNLILIKLYLVEWAVQPIVYFIPRKDIILTEAEGNSRQTKVTQQIENYTKAR